MRYSETHYHGLSGGIEVMPKLTVKVGKKADTLRILRLPRVGSASLRSIMRSMREKTLWQSSRRAFSATAMTT